MEERRWPVIIGRKTTTLNVADRGNNTLAIERWGGGLILLGLDEAVELAVTLCLAVEEIQATEAPEE